MTPAERVAALEAERLTGMPRWQVGPPLTPLDLDLRRADVQHQLRRELARDEKARQIIAHVRPRRAA